jgi:GNAT superfamily N-acetyltransferase
MTDFSIRRAAKADAPVILALLGELAAYEKLTDKFQLTETLIMRDLLDGAAVAYCDIAFWRGEPAGLSVWYWIYRSFRAQRGLFVEDLYVRPQFRGRGFGRALLGHLARSAAEAGAGWMEWLVLDWNTPSIAFYKSLGAAPVKDWIGYRLEGEAMTGLAI